MKIEVRAWWPGTMVLAFASVSLAQVAVPPNPGKAGKRNLGESGGAGSSTGAVVAPPRPVVVQHVAVTPVQAWVNAEGKTMEARLLAWSVPAEGETGPVEIIREGKVRFLVSGRKEPLEYPLAKLGGAERAKIEGLAKAAAKGPPQAP